MVEWTPVFVLPNIKLAEAIEGELAILAPSDDPRVEAVGQVHETFRIFLNRFTDAFGATIEPTVLLLRSNAPDTFFHIDALASFRDLISFAVISYSRALELTSPPGHHVFYGDAFDFYPWMVANDCERLIRKTPAVAGIHEVGKFQGQSSPKMSQNRLDSRSVDEPLLRELLVRWRRQYESDKPSWKDTALFRSLNMAYHASLMPAGSDARLYDAGRIISLWVSAFEILVHPGGENGRATRDKVFELIEKVDWKLSACKESIHKTGDKKKLIERTLASWLYQKLYDCRNDFLHGNPEPADRLLLPGSGRHLFNYAAPLYRLALMAFLPLEFVREEPSMSDAEAFGSFVAERMSFLEPQHMVEKAILTALQSSEDAERQ